MRTVIPEKIFFNCDRCGAQLTADDNMTHLLGTRSYGHTGVKVDLCEGCTHAWDVWLAHKPLGYGDETTAPQYVPGKRGDL
jgi:hypothetical protein